MHGHAWLARYLVGVLVMLLWTVYRGVPPHGITIEMSDRGEPPSWIGLMFSIGVVVGIVVHAAAWPVTLPLRIYKTAFPKVPSP